MGEIKTMNKMKKGEKATVYRLDLCGSMRRRLLDMGLIEGTKIECLHLCPLGNLRAYLIRGAVIALRSEDSGLIQITDYN